VNYQVRVILPEKIVTHRNIDIIFELANAKGKPLHDLEPLMGTDGHCVIIISSDAKEFLHVHLVEGVDPELRGTAGSLHDKLSKAGLYKIWGQLQHKGNTIAKSFIVSVADDASND
jgi:hypothetical protein